MSREKRRTYTVEMRATVVEHLTVRATRPEEAVKIARKKARGGTDVRVDLEVEGVEWRNGQEERGLDYAGLCESCEKPLFVPIGDDPFTYRTDEDGVRVCLECYP